MEIPENMCAYEVGQRHKEEVQNYFNERLALYGDSEFGKHSALIETCHKFGVGIEQVEEQVKDGETYGN